MNRLQLGICPFRTNAGGCDHLEVRLRDRAGTLLGWVTGAIGPASGRSKMRGPTCYPFYFGEIDSLGCMTGAQTMIATRVFEASLTVDRFMIMEDKGPALPGRLEIEGIPEYAVIESAPLMGRDAIKITAAWRVLPVTMDLYEQLFDHDLFLPAGVADMRYEPRLGHGLRRDPGDTDMPIKANVDIELPIKAKVDNVLRRAADELGKMREHSFMEAIYPPRREEPPDVQALHRVIASSPSRP